ncbi:MAG: hydrolase [Devosia sp.]|nr:hydrolase [Devosia sp.]
MFCTTSAGVIEPDRTMLAFSLGPDRRFQMRAVAIIRRDGHVLIHRATHETFWSLPGGRVEFGETAAETLEREIVEELGCTSKISELRYLVENFFTYNGEACHEIGWYYEAELSSAFPFLTDDICHRATDGAFGLEFRWVKCDLKSFGVYPLLPPMLPSQLVDTSPGFRHIVERQS